MWRLVLKKNVEREVVPRTGDFDGFVFRGGTLAVAVAVARRTMTQGDTADKAAAAGDAMEEAIIIYCCRCRRHPRISIVDMP